MRRLVWRSLGATSVVLSGVAYVNRPVYREEPFVVPGKQEKQSITSAISNVSENDEFARTGLYSPRTEDESSLLKAARLAAISLVMAFSRVVMEVLNDTKIVGSEKNYKELLHQIDLGKERKRGLITVSNHTSVYDDPVLQSSIIKFMPNPDKMRWGVCKESICFGNRTAAAFTGAGKVLPIRVGAGVEQKAFKAVGRRLADGEWIHIYPEAACIQSGELGKNQYFGCREEGKAKKVGLLKWGVGKLAARTAFQDKALPPLLIPYYHVGMEKIRPQHNNPDSNSLVDPWYILARTGNKVRVFVGEPIVIDDLIEDYERKVGKSRRVAFVNDANEFKDWDGSTPEEFELYSKITLRVQEALLRLEQEAKETMNTN